NDCDQSCRPWIGNSTCSLPTQTGRIGSLFILGSMTDTSKFGPCAWPQAAMIAKRPAVTSQNFTYVPARAPVFAPPHPEPTPAPCHLGNWHPGHNRVCACTPLC